MRVLLTEGSAFASFPCCHSRSSLMREGREREGGEGGERGGRGERVGRRARKGGGGGEREKVGVGWGVPGGRGGGGGKICHSQKYRPVIPVKERRSSLSPIDGTRSWQTFLARLRAGRLVK